MIRYKFVITLPEDQYSQKHTATYVPQTGVLTIDGHQVYKEKGLIASNWLVAKEGAEILEVDEDEVD